MSLPKFVQGLLLLPALCSPLFGTSTLSWSPNPEANIAGYRLYYRSIFDPTLKMLDAGLNTRATIPDMTPETKYFVSLSAYDVYGLESEPSPEVEFYSSLKTPEIKLSGQNLILTVSGKPGGSYQLFESDDLKSWDLVQAFFNPEGTIDLTLVRDPTARRKFYRLAWNGETFEGWSAAFAQEPLPDDNSTSQDFFIYASGADLMDAPPPGGITFGLISMPAGPGFTNTNYRTLTYTLREMAREVYAHLEVSWDQENWVSANPLLREVSSELVGDGTRAVTYQELRPLATLPEGKPYYRVRYDEAPFDSDWDFNDWLAANNLPHADAKFPGLNGTALYAFASGADLLPNPRQATPRMRVLRDTSTGIEQISMVIAFTVREGLAGYPPSLQVSNDLRTWSSGAEAMVPLPIQANGDGTLTLAYKTDPENAPRRQYYRVTFLTDPVSQ